MAGLDRLIDLKNEAGAAPLALRLGIRMIDVDDGFAVFEGHPSPDYYNPQDVVHGGWTSTLLDSALGCAIETRIPAGYGYGTVELKVNFVRPITGETGRLICRSDVVHSGRRMATSEGRVVDEAGRLYAHGSCTCMIYKMD